VRDGCRAVVQLQVNWPEVVVCVVLVPTHQQTPVWLDPVDPVVLMGHPTLQLKPNFDPRSRHRVPLIIEQLAWVYRSDDTVRASFARFGTPSVSVLERAAESVLDVVVEPLAL
jgi:hypothetical protein